MKVMGKASLSLVIISILLIAGGMLLWRRLSGVGSNGESRISHPVLAFNGTLGGFDVAEDVCVNVNGIYVVGWRFDSLRQESDACVVKLDRGGNLIWNATWTDEWGAHGRGVSCCSNGIYVTGTARKMHYAYVIKFNDMGEQIWNKTWSTDTSYSGRSAYATDEAVYIIGDGKLEKLDADGNRLWERTVSGRALDASSDRIYIAGSTTDGATGGSDALLAAFDLGGNQLWNTTRESIKGDAAVDVCATQDGVYFIGTGSKGWDLRFITKFDLDGKQLWDRSWERSDGGTFLSICSHGGYIYAVGSVGDSPRQFDAFIAKFDIDGNMIWNATFGKPEREDYAHGVCADSEGFYVVGTTESYTLLPRNRLGFLLIYRTEK